MNPAELAHLATLAPDDADADIPADWLRADDAPSNGAHTSAQPRDTHAGAHAIDGAAFILNEPSTVPAAWGQDDQVIWAEGEPLMIVGPDGVGKTTLAQQLVLARIGLRRTLLGLPVQSDSRRVLYIAADRPRQAARSFARMTGIADETILRERLAVWRGPLPFDITQTPGALTQLAHENACTDVVIDSLKDITFDLSKDETGSRVNVAFQHVIAAGVELCILHHQRKEGRDGTGKPKKLADVYGSRWLTAGMGSVLCLWGEPGDPLVELLHLKQPAEDIGPLKLLHDHARGKTTIETSTSVQEILIEHAATGLEVKDLARRLYQKDQPGRGDIEKARRRLESLVQHGHAERSTNLNGQTIYKPADAT
jgi:replicative DNA helicase